MNTREVLFYLAAVLLCGCVPVFSLNGLYTDKDLVFEKDLLGTWADPNDPEVTWRFTPGRAQNEYRLVFTDKDRRKGSFEARLVKLKDRLFLDVHPDRPPCDLEDPNKVEWYYNSVLLVPVHTFFRVDSVGPGLVMYLTDDQKIKKLFEQEPDCVAHSVVDQTPLLTASTKELQAFVLKYADDERLFANRVALEPRERKGTVSR